jgi:hypothetical protein
MFLRPTSTFGASPSGTTVSAAAAGCALRLKKAMVVTS